MTPTAEIPPRIGIVLLNWNQPDHTLACLASLRCLSYASFEVVVVDNGSTDGSPALIRQLAPEAIVIENGANLGFAAGNNVGIRHLLNRGADCVLLLNNDTEVAQDMLTRLAEAALAYPDAGILGPKILYFTPGDVIWSAGGSVDRFGRVQHLCVDQLDDGLPQSAQEVDYVTGCAFLVKREVIDKVGVLNEDFFIYYEETEWCARAKAAGFKVLYVPGARVWHKIEQSARSTSRRYLYLMSRNRLLYLKCRGGSPAEILFASLELLRTAAAWALRPRHRALRGLSSAVVHGVWDFTTGHFGVPPARP